MKITWQMSLTLGLCLLTTSSAFARPAHKQALAQFMGPSLAKKLNDCRTCHLPDVPGKTSDDVEKPHNAFGARLAAVRGELRKAGKPNTVEDRLDAILNEDSDGDGAGNLVELLTGHFPGDKDDRPSPAELDKSQALVAAFLRAKQAYPWRPFEVVKRPVVPKVQNASWGRNPIDAFIAAEHEALNLKPRPEAPKQVLLRRVYLDLIGLPPTPAQLEAFLQDTSPNAYEKVVDQLLNSPQHGERWGRHWMDVWRYSDWAGFGAQIRDSQPHIWRWRDWIIDSLNEDKGYDRMVQEMLAGDELAPEDPKALAGTGYLVRNWKLLSREKWLQDSVEHTFLAFQAVTIGCAKCHDHMYDPLLQKEYYQVRAIFEPHNVRIDRIPGQPDTKVDGLARVYDKDLAVPTFLFLRGDDRTPEKSKPLTPAVPEFLGGTFAKIDPVNLPVAAVQPDKRDFVIKELIDVSAKEVAQAEAELATWRKQTESHTKPVDEKSFVAKTQAASRNFAIAERKVAVKKTSHEALLKVLEAEKLEEAGKEKTDAWKKIATEAAAAQFKAAVALAEYNLELAKDKLRTEKMPPSAAAIKAVDDAKKALEKADADAKQPPSVNYKKRTTTTFPPTSTGRRLALAKWMANKDNPLTARVAVNHVWLRHFGQAIVPSTFDFGRNGRPPSHPALLDWLAAEFMEKGWKMKDLHRLIVTSAAYRQHSTPDEASEKLDRDNKYLWRYPPHRLEAEAVRDAMFYVAGKLDMKMGGPEIDFPLGLTVPRRSVYFRHAAEKQMEFLAIFDGPSVTECYERKHSIIPQQALALFNSEVALKHSRLLARQIAAEVKDDGVFTTRAFAHVLTRTPTAEELAACATFLQEQTERFRTAKLTGQNVDGSLPASDPVLRARENLVHVLLNHHEFVTIR